MTGSLADRIVREIEQAAGLYHRLLELTARLRVLRLPDLLREIAGGASGGIVLLDNIEILFDAGRQHDPLLLLQGLSRGKTVVAAWNGAAGLVVNTVDRIAHGMKLGIAGMHNQARQWAAQPFLAELVDLLLLREEMGQPPPAVG